MWSWIAPEGAPGAIRDGGESRGAIRAGERAGLCESERAEGSNASVICRQDPGDGSPNVDPAASPVPSGKAVAVGATTLPGTCRKKAASFSRIFHNYAHQWQSHSQPNLWPVVGLLRSSFGRRSDPFSGEGAFHTGIDIAVPSGTPVHVTADGVVESAGWRGGYGKLVIIDHGNGLETCYAHLSQLLVVPGEEVRRNEIIALTGTSGHTTGPHIHYEVRVAGTAVNPYRYLRTSAPKTEVASTGKTTHNDLGL